MPSPWVGLPPPVTHSTARMVPTIVAIGISMFLARGFTPLTGAEDSLASWAAEAGSSSSPVRLTLSSAFFMGPKSREKTAETKAKSTAMMQ